MESLKGTIDRAAKVCGSESKLEFSGHEAPGEALREHDCAVHRRCLD